ncbi:TIGR02597 family protein [Pelagicoccus albus]|uniref:TIGR02597 family protein n=1 Tax=Pelagicoccus albus TaxID=415222 RepID=A0A7X1B5H1_9BACT|nr:TIGR02597 family protein [Pelagicoccus albus]
MSKYLFQTTALALLATPFCSLHAQEVYSATIGAVSIEVPSQSDVMVALPFKREKAAGGTVSSVSGSVATLSSSSLTAGEFDAPSSGATHYLYVEDGTLKGHRLNIVSNTASSVTVDESDISDLNGASVTIREHWTLGTLFPEGVGYNEEDEPGLREIEVVLPELASLGGGLAANRIFYFYNAAWREVGTPLAEAVDSVVIEPGVAFVVRNNSYSDLDYFFFGEVEYGPIAIPLVSSSDVVDNFVAMERPLGMAISDLQLESLLGTDDRLLVYPMSSSGLLGLDKEPSVYLYADSKWQLEGGDGSDVGSTIIGAGQGIAVRKAAGADGGYWVNEWSLAQ